MNTESFFRRYTRGVGDFSGEVLTYVDFKGASLIGVDFRNANLNGADLSGVDLTGACLRGASIWDANIKGAILPKEPGPGVISKACRDKAWLVDIRDVTRYPLTKALCKYESNVWWVSNSNIVYTYTHMNNLRLATAKDMLELSDD